MINPEFIQEEAVTEGGTLCVLLVVSTQAEVLSELVARGWDQPEI